ncbi:MAG: hypothetical protein K2G19_11840, partial [Lachnospiraceae bacterium]|nr:hypothetical protein [Lachnospiraceae bacterium]
YRAFALFNRVQEFFYIIYVINLHIVSSSFLFFLFEFALILSTLYLADNVNSAEFCRDFQGKVSILYKKSLDSPVAMKYSNFINKEKR